MTTDSTSSSSKKNGRRRHHHHIKSSSFARSSSSSSSTTTRKSHPSLNSSSSRSTPTRIRLLNWSVASTTTTTTRPVVLLVVFLFIGISQLIDISRIVYITEQPPASSPSIVGSRDNTTADGAVLEEQDSRRVHPAQSQPQRQDQRIPTQPGREEVEGDVHDPPLTSSPPSLVFHMIWKKTKTKTKANANANVAETNGESGSTHYTPQMALETICYHHRYYHDKDNTTAATAAAAAAAAPPSSSSSLLSSPVSVVINIYVIGEDLVETERHMIDELNNNNNGGGTFGCTIQVHVLSSLLAKSSSNSINKNLTKRHDDGWAMFFEDTPLQEFAQEQYRLFVESQHQQQQQQQEEEEDDEGQKKKEKKKIHMNVENFKELFRIATLWKHGGIFVEADVAWAQPVVSSLLLQRSTKSLQSPSSSSSSSSSPSSLYYSYKNTMANTGRVSTTAFSSFRPNHPFLVAVMEELTKKKTETNYDDPSIVESLVSQTATNWTNKCPSNLDRNVNVTTTTEPAATSDGTDDDDEEEDDCLTVLPRYTYYPCSEKRCQMLFEPATDLTEKKVFGNPDLYAVRYFGSVNSGRMMHENSTLYKLYKKSCVLCNLPKSNSTISTSRPKFNLLQLAEMKASTNITAMTPTTPTGLQTPPSQTSLTQWTNLTTMSYFGGRFYSGYRNQMQVFLMLMIEAVDQGYGQFIVDSILMKDTFGSNEHILFQDLYDVPYWNSFYPQVPRLVLADPLLNPTFDPDKRMPYLPKRCTPGNVKKVLTCVSSPTGIEFKDLPSSAQSRYMELKKINQTDEVRLPKNSPKYTGVFSHLMGRYSRYSRGLKGPIHPVDVVSQKALRPHPDVQAVIDKILDDMKGPRVNHRTSPTNVTMMTIHARVEPDMQKHPMCKHQKVYLLKEIVAWTEQLPQFVSNPPSFVFLSLAKELLDDEVVVNPNNTIAKDNLGEVQRLLHEGMWNSTVKVYHGYDGVLNGTRYENRTSTTQAMISYYLSLQSDVFIGTPVSSYSQAVAASRFHRDRFHLLNYQYLPDGLHDWTPPELQRPPPFQC